MIRDDAKHTNLIIQGLRIEMSIFEACQRDDDELLRRIIEEAPEKVLELDGVRFINVASVYDFVNYSFHLKQDRSTPLHEACRCGSGKAVKVLLSSGVDTDVMNKVLTLFNRFINMLTVCREGILPLLGLVSGEGHLALRFSWMLILLVLAV